MSIYARTGEGQLAAYSTQSALPRKLKSILKVVDGKTCTEMFEQNLRSFGDVKAILRSLEIAGLLHAATEDAQRVRFNLELNDAEHQKLMQVGEGSDLAATSHSLDKPSLMEHVAAEHYSQPYFGLSGRPQAEEQERGEALAAIVNDMSNFVLTYVPEHSFQMLKEIEDISSLEIFAATLGGYEQMVAHLGEKSTEHLRNIKSILRDRL